MGSATIGRLFVEIGGDVKQLNAALGSAMEAAKAAGIVVNKSGQAFIASFNDALNPTKKLAEQIMLLEKAGKSNAEIFAVMGDRMKQAAGTATAHGQAIDPLVAKHIELNKTVAAGGISFADLGKTMTDFARNPVEASKQGVIKLMESLGPTAVGIAGIATAAGVAGVGLYKFIEGLADSYERLANLSNMTGESISRLQAMEEITTQAGMAGMDLGRVLSRVNEQLGDSKPNDFTNAMKRMNIEGRDAVTVLTAMQAQWQAIEDPQKRSQQMMADLGLRYRELGGLLIGLDKPFKDHIENLEHMVASSDAANASYKQMDATLDKIGLYFRTGKELWKEWISLGSAAAVVYARELSERERAHKQFMDQFKAEVELVRQGNAQKIQDRETFEQKIAAIRERGVRSAREAAEAEAKAFKDAYDKMRKTLDDLNNAVIAAWDKQNEAVYQYIQAQLREKMKIDAEMLAAHREFHASLAAISQKGYDDLEKIAADAASNTKRIYSGLPGMSKEEIDAAVKRAEGGFEAAGKHAEVFADKCGREISTVFNDIAKDIADAIMDWSSPGKAIMDSLKAFGKGMLRILLEELLNPFAIAFRKVIQDLLSKINLPNSSGGGTGTGSGGAGSNMGDYGAIGGAIAALAIASYNFAKGTFGEEGNRNKWQAMLGDAATGSGLFSLITFLKGESSWTAMTKELIRDFGGVAMSFKDIAAYFKSTMNITEPEAWDIRKDLLSSPAFLTQMAYPMALQEKKLDEFLKSLEKIQTAWGSGNFRAAFEEWMNTGSVTALNKAYVDLFGSSKDLNSALKNWQDILLLLDNSTAALNDTIKKVEATGRASADALEYLGRQVAASGASVDIFGNRIISTNQAMADWVDNLRSGGAGGGAGARTITPIIPISQVRGGIQALEYLGRAARGTGAYINAFGQLVNTAGAALAAMSTTGIRSMNAFSGAVARASGAAGGASGGVSSLPSAITGPMSSFMYSGVGPAVYNASLGPDPNSSAWDIWRARLAEAIGSQSGPTYIFNGDVYGFEDFINAVMAANADINRRGGVSGGTNPAGSRR